LKFLVFYCHHRRCNCYPYLWSLLTYLGQYQNIWRYITTWIPGKAQIALGSSRHVSTRLNMSDVSSESRRACRAVLFQHGGKRTSYSARLYKFSRFYALTYTDPICSVKLNKYVLQ